MNWQPIETYHKCGTLIIGKTAKLGRTVMFGKYWEEQDLWLWMASGHIEDEEIFIDATDKFYPMKYYQDPTHWAELDEARP